MCTAGIKVCLHPAHVSKCTCRESGFQTMISVHSPQKHVQALAQTLMPVVVVSERKPAQIMDLSLLLAVGQRKAGAQRQMH